MTAQIQEGVAGKLSAFVNDQLFTERHRRRMTQTQFAELLGMSRTQISARDRGEKPWTLDEVQRAAHVLGVPLAVLLLPRLESNQQPSGYGDAQVIDLAVERERRLGAAA